jgi:outer membrane protein assembly factor BamD
MNKIKALGFGLLALSLVTGCAKKDDISNQTAYFWHNSIYVNITKHNLDVADDRFTSLEIEHPNSQYIPIDLLNLAMAHLYNEEFQLAEFYINEYEKRYANRYEKEWCEYQKAKIRFLSLTNAYTNQKKLEDTLKFVNSVLDNYPDSIYIYELNTMK